MVLQPNQTLHKGKYTIDRLLGQGRFGMTYLARRSPDQDPWVIKILNPQALVGLSAAERDRVETFFCRRR